MSSTSCFLIHPTAKTGRVTWHAWAARRICATRGFVIEHAGDPEYSLVTRTSDGQMLFLTNKLSKMKQHTPLGSRIAEVHNGSSLFTGDAGQGESNIRRWIIENDWLEAIVALPLNMFYNTGIATYVWVLTNRKPDHRKGKVQLIDATKRYQPLRKNLGKKNCELGEKDIAWICETFLGFEENEQSKIFDNAAFGYWKVTVERPLRIKGIDSKRAYKAAEIRRLKASGERSETAPPVIRKIHKRGTMAAPLYGLFASPLNGRSAVVEYEPDTDLRDTEQIPLLEEGGIDGFLRREVLSYAGDAWYQPNKAKIGYEISFNRYFYKSEPMRTLQEIRADILALEHETDGLLAEILGEKRVMIANLTPYPEMKDSDATWLGPVPEHWDLRRLKNVLQQRNEKGHPDEPLLAATQTKGVVRKEHYENRTVLAMKDLHLLKLVHLNDFVISLRSFQGGIEYARQRGIISPAYTVLYPVRPKDHGYLAHLFKSAPYIQNLSLSVTGIRQGQNIDYEKLSRSRIPIPPLREQNAIVRFLDHADQCIRRYIRAKERLIELLEEQKQAIIHQAVTGQIDVRTGHPYPAYKDTGVEWLEKVPEHWEVSRLGRLLKLVVGFPFKSEGFTQSDDDIRLLRGVNIAPGRLRWDSVVRWPVEDADSFAEYRLQVGDIVLGMDRPIIRGGTRVAVVSESDVPSLLLQRVARVRVGESLIRDFAMALLGGKGFS